MKKEVKILILIGGLFVVATVAGAMYYRNSSPGQRVATTTNTNSAAKPAIPAETLVRPDSPTLGSADAPVTIVEFLDPECESCAAFAPVVKKVMGQFEGKTRLVIRYMPLHPNSMLAANLLEAAGEQGKYWQMYDLLMQKQPEWGTRHGPVTTPQPDAPALFDKYAKELGLDMTKVGAVLKESRFKSKVERDHADGRSLGVRQTPTIFVNGRRMMRLSEGELRMLVENALTESR